MNEKTPAVETLQKKEDALLLPAHPSLWRRLLVFSKKQEGSHLLWLAFILVSQCCILTPGLSAVILLTGPHFVLFMIALVMMMFALVSSLAFLPTTVIIPVFALNVTVDLAIVIWCLVT